MTEAVFIGVDGGASKTHAVVLDAAGAVLGEARGPAATLNGTADTAWATIQATLSGIDTLAGRSKASRHVVVGIAGTEIESAYRAFVAAAPVFSSCRVVSDAHIACAGAHARIDGTVADGAIVAIGTGLVGFARSRGESWRAGGWGFPHDDRGAGAWLGLEAVAHALAAADGRGRCDALAATLLAEYDDDPVRLSAWACTARASDFARYAPTVIDAARTGDATAEALLDAAGEHVSTLARAVLGSRNNLTLALVGGLADTLEPRLAPDLRARLVAARHSAAHGAALMAARAFSEIDA